MALIQFILQGDDKSAAAAASKATSTILLLRTVLWQAVLGTYGYQHIPQDRRAGSLLYNGTPPAACCSSSVLVSLLPFIGPWPNRNLSEHDWH
jgi:hypothetical protein